MAQFFEVLFSEGGSTFQLNVLGDRILATHEAENIEAIVNSKLQSFTTSSRLSIIGVLIKNSVMTQQGPVWKHTRGLMRVPLSRPQYHDLTVVKRHVDNLIAVLPTEQPVDLTPLFFRFTMDAATSFLFGKSVNSLVLPRAAEEEEFEKAFDYCFAYVMRRGRLGKLCWLLNGAEFRKASGMVFTYIDKVIAEASTRRCLSEEQIDFTRRGRTPLLDALLGGKDDKSEVRDHMLLTLAAARQTTTALLTWTLRLLVRYPSAMARLREEIITVVDDAGTDTPLTRDHIKRMTYLSCILQEVLRLYPLSHAIASVAKEDVVLPVGGGEDGKAPILLRAGEAVNICLWTLHRRKDIWGEDAEDFRPERWEGDVRLPTLFYYIPFLRGPRNCPGQDFALTEASYLIIRLLQEFPVVRIARTDPMPVTDKKTERFKMGFVIESADGCLLEFER
ncbi:putative Cytochrome P450 alkane hydroxylase [Seiridium cardinale]